IRAPPSSTATRLDRVVTAMLDWIIRNYAATLRIVLRHRAPAMVVMSLTIGFAVVLYTRTPKGYFPQGDVGLVYVYGSASTDTSFRAMSELQRRAMAIVEADPAIKDIGSWIYTSNFELFVTLKPLAERKLSAALVIDRLRAGLAAVTELRFSLFAL